MIAAFARTFGRGERDVGTIWLLTGLGLCLPMLFTGWILAPLGRMRGLIAVGHGGAAVLLLGLALATALFEPAVVRWLHLGMVPAFFVLIGVQIPAWFALAGDLFTPHMQARVLGATFAVNRVGALAGGGLAAWILGREADPSRAWTWLFAIAGVAGMLGCLPYLLWTERPRRPRPRPALRAHLSRLARTWSRWRGFRRFVLADLPAVGAFITLALYADAAFARHPEWSKALAGRWTQAGALGMLLGCLIVVGVGDRVRPRHWLAVGAAMAACGSVGAVFAGGVFAYAGVGMACGFFMGLRVSCHGPAVMRMVPLRARTHALGLIGMVGTLAQGVVIFVAGLVAAWVGYEPLLVAAAVLVVVSGVLMLAWVPRGRAPHLWQGRT